MKEVIIPLTSIVCIAGLAAYAVNQGIDGVILAGSFTIIGGLGGYQARVFRDRFRR